AKVFPFGPLKSASENIIERLATAPPPADYALVTTRHSVLIWSARVDLNLMTGQSPRWKRTFITKLCGRNPPERICKWFGVTSNFFSPETAGPADSWRGKAPRGWFEWKSSSDATKRVVP